MSGWLYMKSGILNEETIGPVSDSEIGKLAYDGRLTLKTRIIHPVHTKNEWTTVNQIPALVKRIEQGQIDLATEKKRKKEQQDLERTEKKRINESDRALAQKRKAEREAAETEEARTIAAERDEARAAIQVERNKRPDSAMTANAPRYGALKSYADFCGILGFLCLIGAGMLVLGSFLSIEGLVGGNWIFFLVSAVALGLNGFFLLVTQKAITAFVDIADNSHKSVEALGRIQKTLKSDN